MSTRASEVEPDAFYLFFFFNDTATTEIYTLSLHDALPISRTASSRSRRQYATAPRTARGASGRSEEHTSELQSRPHLVCRLLLEKKKLDVVADLAKARYEMW